MIGNGNSSTKRSWVSIGSVIAVALLLAALILALVHDQVDDSQTAEDVHYIQLIMGNERPPLDATTLGYSQQIKLIKAVQGAVLKIASRNVGLPFDMPREPKNVYIAESGLCYDRSRVIEKILRYYGFRTRHVALYALDGRSWLRTLITPAVHSHAVSEVLTAKGWLVVGSNTPWISVDKFGSPVSIKRICNDVGKHEISFSYPMNNPIYLHPFLYVYGLYSRHGRFYPPYNFVPDVNYWELAQNL